MTQENGRRIDLQIAQWALLALLILGCLVAYFRYSSVKNVPPVIRPATTVEAQ